MGEAWQPLSPGPCSGAGSVVPASTGPPEDELDEVDDPDAPDEELVEPEDDELDELLDELALASAPASTGAGQPWIFTCVQPFVASHVSVVHASPSSQLPPLPTGTFLHPCTGSQLSVVHGLSSLQSTITVPRHCPSWHIDALEHAVPSSQAPARGAL